MDDTSLQQEAQEPLSNNLMTDSLLQPIDSQDKLFTVNDGPQSVSESNVLNPFVGVSPDEDNKQQLFDIPQAKSEPVPIPQQTDDGMDKDSLTMSGSHDGADFDPLKDWGHPMDLPAPPPPTSDLNTGTSFKSKTAGKVNGTTKPGATKSATSRLQRDNKKTEPAKTTRKPPTTTTTRTVKKEVKENGVSKPPATSTVRRARPATGKEYLCTENFCIYLTFKVRVIIMITSRLSSNSEVFTSESLQNLEEKFPLHYMENVVISRFKSLTIHWCVTRCKRVNYFFTMHVPPNKHFFKIF